MKVGIVGGATGAVGQELLKVFASNIKEGNIKDINISCYASKKI